ncbi:VanZ family protein [Cuneatibacter caecimuris]|uniref:VanZ family protein n=1 Tax=Cuneatibacter caecimuris TaxID=1796618 RepID=A0A4Q7P0Y7_9FIRM|nr:VanZ family protein [Cuneatibacter caecimuris]RZS93030.1 VanZ family protein [Cuneatibacter caecimuris]
MKKQRDTKWIWLALTAGFTCFIFGNSALPGTVSSGNSGFALDILQNVLSFLGLPGEWLTEHVIRKSAHFAEYAALGLLLSKTWKMWFPESAWRKWPVLFLGLLTPVLDETLQLFVEGRSGQVSDVVLDFSGVLAGCFLAWAAGKIKNL